MLTVYGVTASRALRVFWLLEELGTPYRRVESAPHSPEVEALYAAGKIPVAVEGGEVLTDSTAILHWLADRAGRFTHPAGTIPRARQDAATFFLLDELDACLWTAARHSFMLPEERRISAVKETLRWEWTTSVRRLSERIRGPFLMGEEMTVPDIIAAHCIGWAQVAKFPVEDDRVLDYARRLRQRPAFRRATGKPEG